MSSTALFDPELASQALAMVAAWMASNPREAMADLKAGDELVLCVDVLDRLGDSPDSVLASAGEGIRYLSEDENGFYVETLDERVSFYVDVDQVRYPS